MCAISDVVQNLLVAHVPVDVLVVQPRFQFCALEPPPDLEPPPALDLFLLALDPPPTPNLRSPDPLPAPGSSHQPWLLRY
eukprot:CAMPEP_0174700570 /NCGR_PEP_ID=MMETSP1094-20130205/5489_1 /TAXON_ID=156173 /ORGANISM="Chrysochromulina brevifilum, Strain UTEX LB 985" /LENGTH=79 /DNA_ID=CAMNT_0015898073 /DNA_START=157 /DNA_END=396 /DNA_ORIENTATION=-